MSDGNGTPTEDKVTKYPFHEFVVDLFGGLIPGSLFLFGAALALLPPLYLISVFLLDKKNISFSGPFITFSDIGKHCLNRRADVSIL